MADQTPVTGSQLPRDLLLIIFVHGFKGTDETFRSFPSRLQHVLSESIEQTSVESVVFPAYETKGELDKAVERLADWLTTLVVEKEVAHGTGGGAGKAKVVLCGHSMGGLLTADTLLAIIRNRPDSTAPVWPNIIACLSFDTPYFGVHPHVFKSSTTKALGYAHTAHKTATDIWGTFSSLNKAKGSPSTVRPAGFLGAPPSDTGASGSAWSKWAPVAAYSIGGALLAGAAAGTAFYNRDELVSRYTYVQDHMKYAGNLWDEASLQRRVDGLLQAERDHDVTFRNYYTLLPADLTTHMADRTFILTPSASEAAARFEQARNTLAADEVQAHVGMFEAGTNDGYYQLGLAVAGIIRNALTKRRGESNTRQENLEEVVKHSAEFANAATEESSEFTANPWTE